MYGVPANLDLECLIGAELYGIHVYRYDVQFVFYNELRFMVMN